MRQNLSLVTLGVRDMQKSRAFYEAVGWKVAEGSDKSVVFFNLHGIILSLFPRGELAKDAGVSPEGSGFGGITLAHNAKSEEEVNAVLNDAKKAGAKIIKEAGKTFWGGFSGYFSDPDGFLWEVAHNPYWSFDKEGRIIIPEKTDAHG